MKNKSKKTKPNNIQYQLIYIYLIIETKSKKKLYEIKNPKFIKHPRKIYQHYFINIP